MDIGRSFSYLTEDQDWVKKVLLAGLISLIPVIGQFYLFGYVLEALKNVIAGREIPLPEVTEDFGGKLLKGLLLAVILFIYYIPASLIGACSGIGSAVFPGIIDDPDTAGYIVSAWSACFGCISFLYSILVGLLLPFVWAKFAETGQFGDAFKLGEIFGMLKSNIGQAIIVMIVSGLVMGIAGFVGLLVCIIGLIFTMPYAQLVTAFLYGSLYRKAKAAVL